MSEEQMSAHGPRHGLSPGLILDALAADACEAVERPRRARTRKGPARKAARPPEETPDADAFIASAVAFLAQREDAEVIWIRVGDTLGTGPPASSYPQAGRATARAPDEARPPVAAPAEGGRHAD